MGCVGNDDASCSSLKRQDQRRNASLNLTLESGAAQMITIKPESLVRDLAFLQLAEDDQLAELGYHYGNIRPRSTHDVDAIDESADALIMNWSDGVLDRDNVFRQRVCLAVVGPTVRASKDLLQETLKRAGDSLLAAADSRPPIIAVTISTPHIMQGVGGELVTVGFDVFSPA